MREANLNAPMLLQIHDELIFEADANAASEIASLVKREMESAQTLSVPLTVTLKRGASWFDVESFDLPAE
jgi:DNA polymerase-1